jgi:putative ATP-binding cassette transporter
VFLPARAYVPPGTLRSALAYPHSAGDFADAAIAQAFAQVGLERLQPRLDTTERWDRVLSEDEKQSLAFARVILQRPQWLVSNGAFDLLDPISRARIEGVFAGPLANVGLINISPERAGDALVTRRLQLVSDPQGPTFSPAAEQATASQ